MTTSLFTWARSKTMTDDEWQLIDRWLKKDKDLKLFVGQRGQESHLLVDYHNLGDDPDIEQIAVLSRKKGMAYVRGILEELHPRPAPWWLTVLDDMGPSAAYFLLILGFGFMLIVGMLVLVLCHVPVHGGNIIP